jgi:hypothetical protein
MADGPAKTARLAAWVQGLYEGLGSAPILVGGAVVELITGGAYTTGDLDFAGTVPKEIAARLRESGFEKKGRHWLHAEGELFLDFPSEQIDANEGSVLLEFAGHRIEVLAPEALLVDRLAAWEFWDSTTDGVNAFLILRAAKSDLDKKKLNQLAVDHKVDHCWQELRRFDSELGDREPTAEEIEAWAERKGS